jgi:hypothetical protein
MPRAQDAQERHARSDFGNRYYNLLNSTTRAGARTNLPFPGPFFLLRPAPQLTDNTDPHSPSPRELNEITVRFVSAAAVFRGV